MTYTSIIILTLTLLLFGARVSLADTLIENPKLQIVLDIDTDPNTQKSWSKNCKKILNIFTKKSNSIPENLPTFAQGQCILSLDQADELVKSPKEQNTDKPIQNYFWRILFRKKSSYVQVSFSFHFNDNEYNREEVVFKVKNDVKSFFDSLNPQDLAELISINMPYWQRVSLPASATEFRVISSNEPTQLVLQKLYFNEKDGFYPKIAGSAQRSKDLFNSYGSEGSRYVLDSFYAQPKPSEFMVQKFWQEGEKESNSKQLLNKMTKERSWLSFVDELLFDSLSSSFAGIRYGYNVTSGDEIIANSNFISALIEIRSGPLDGLRYFYDISPEAKRSISGSDNQESFSWSRGSLGWSFAYEPEGFLGIIAPKIDLVPRVGLMDLNADLYVTASSLNEVLNFSTKNSLSTGFELGIEHELNRFRTRLWLQSDIAGFIQVKGSDSIRSIKAGIDLTYDMTKIYMFDLTLLTFANLESITFTKTSLDSEQTNISSLSYNLSFIGLGLLISW